MLVAMLLLTMCFICIRRRQQRNMIAATKRVVAARCEREKQIRRLRQVPVYSPLVPPWKKAGEVETVDVTYMKILANKGSDDDGELEGAEDIASIGGRSVSVYNMDG